MSEFDLIKQWMTWKRFQENSSYSYEDLASDVGLDLETLIKLLSVQVSSDDKTIPKIASIFGVTLSEFFNGPPENVSGKDHSIPANSTNITRPLSPGFTPAQSSRMSQEYGLNLSRTTQKELDELFRLLGFESNELFEPPVDISSISAEKVETHASKLPPLTPEETDIPVKSDKKRKAPHKKKDKKSKESRCKIIAIANYRGGSGKTTCAVNIGYGLARLNKNVLLIDGDSKANLTEALGIHESEYKTTLNDLIQHTAQLSEVIIEKYGLSLIPSRRFSWVPDGVRNTFTDKKILKKVLGEITGFDYMLIDCPSLSGEPTVTILMASDEVIIPILPEYISVSGIDTLVDTVHALNDEEGCHLNVSMVIASRYNKDYQHHRDMMERLHQRFGETVMCYTIRDDVAISEALRDGKPVIEYNSKSPASEDFLNLCQKIVTME